MPKQLKQKNITNDKTLQKFREVHKYKYDYSLVNTYPLYENKLYIICPDHGEFIQNKTKHMTGQTSCEGCKKNKRYENANKIRKTTTEFISESRALHGNKYDYSLSKYISAHEDIIIICPTHGQFSQPARNHCVSGKGCRKCGYARPGNGGWWKPEEYRDRSTTLYYIKIEGSVPIYKIGISMKDTKKRFRADILSGINIKVIKEWKFKDGYLAFINEANIKRKYKKFKYEGLDILKSGNTELFTIDILGLDDA